MRGTLSNVPRSARKTGLIPTYAGNTLFYRIHCFVSGAHPHVCGEHTSISRPVCVPLGSSPRMRGTLLVPAGVHRSGGLIPTYAGNTLRQTAREDTLRAHPHVCGEHLEARIGHSEKPGSSPRMRGTRPARPPSYHLRGLIPTYAGNTSPRLLACRRSRAHPHVCGEHLKHSVHGTNGLGSSPRMRGTRIAVIACQAVVGLIPTYAGNTYPGGDGFGGHGAHPHVCGEHPGRERKRPARTGSSPRMRGTRCLMLIRRTCIGLIPTYAGNTLVDMGFYPHTPSFRISLEPKASINPTRFLGLSPSGSMPIPASFAPPFPWP